MINKAWEAQSGVNLSCGWTMIGSVTLAKPRGGNNDTDKVMWVRHEVNWEREAHTHTMMDTEMLCNRSVGGLPRQG